METMSIQDFAALREMEHDKTSNWGGTTALWVLVAAVIIFAIVYNWTKNCNEKVQFSTALANLGGRLSCIEPDIRWAGQQLYGVNSVVSATVQGVGDMKANFANQLSHLNREVFYDNDDECGCGGHGRGRGRNGGCGCGGGNRRFDQRSTYIPSTTEVIVSETCQN